MQEFTRLMRVSIGLRIAHADYQVANVTVQREDFQHQSRNMCISMQGHLHSN